MKDQILASMMSEDQFSHLHVQSDRGNQIEVFNFLLSILNGQESTQQILAIVIQLRKSISIDEK